MIQIFTKKTGIVCAAIIVIAVVVWLLWRARGPEKVSLTVPAGFTAEVFAQNLPGGPRALIFDTKGRMLVSEPEKGRVVSFEVGSNGKLTQKLLLGQINKPSGLALYVNQDTKTQYLFVATEREVIRYVYDINSGSVADTGTNVMSLPAGGDHPYRSLAIGPNYRTKPIISGAGSKDPGTLKQIKLYVAVGSSCNVCVETTWKYAAILESDLEGTYTAEFAGGLRDVGGIAFNPITKEMWATETGRNGLGASLPSDEINIIQVAGPDQKYGARRYGWPFCYNSKIRDETFNPGKIDRIDLPQDCDQTEFPLVELPAHSSPQGLIFINDSRWPKEWQNNLLVAMSGKIVRFKIDEKGAMSGQENFATGGQPTGLSIGLDGNLYIVDGIAGIIYRVNPPAMI